MDTASLPAWAQTLYLVVTVAGAAGFAVWQGRKAAVKAEPKGEGRVLAATFLDHQHLVDLRTTVANLDGTMREMLEEARELNRNLEIERAIRDAVGRRDPK
jgi:hypothetical protein